MYLFDYLGAIYYWIYLAAISKIRDRDAPKFSEIREGTGRYNKGDIVDMGAYGLKLKMIGVSVTMLICWIIVKSGM
jgi:hypothetical protein